MSSIDDEIVRAKMRKLRVSTFADIFEGITFVDVTGTTQGHGYPGALKRHGVAGQGAAHGTPAAPRRA